MNFDLSNLSYEAKLAILQVCEVDKLEDWQEEFRKCLEPFVDQFQEFEEKFNGFTQQFPMMLFEIMSSAKDEGFSYEECLEQVTISLNQEDKWYDVFGQDDEDDGCCGGGCGCHDN